MRWSRGSAAVLAAAMAMAVAVAVAMVGPGAFGTASAQAAPSVRGCAPTTAGIPAGAAVRRTIDVDGDGRADRNWITATRFGVTTASGATSSVPVAVAGAARPAGLVARLGAAGPVLAFVAGSRDAALFRFTGCGVKPVRSQDGDQWRFDLTGKHGSGVGCQDADGDGRTDLNGLRLTRPVGSVPAGTYLDVTRTIIRVTGTSAASGPADTVSARAGSGALAAATTVTCGTRTLAADGVRATSAGSKAGCPANAAVIPAGADVATIPDVDGDGRADTEYYSEGPGGFAYGIRTASGRTVRLADDLAGPGKHAGWSARFRSGPALTVLSDGRSATLHAFVGCRFVTTADVHGVPWSFGLNGFSPYGSGVQCSSPKVADRVLLGVLAKRQANGRYRIASTTIRVSADGRTAKAGATSTPARTHRADSPVVQQARVSTCWSTPIVATSGR